MKGVILLFSGFILGIAVFILALVILACILYGEPDDFN